jgi:hypothetical protein
VAGGALMALFGRELEDETAMLGAVLLAEGLACLREVGGLVRGLSQGRRRHG